MSGITQRNLGANLAAFDYESDSLFLFNNTTIQGTYTNSSGSEVTIEKGTMMGRNNTTNKFELFDSTSSTSYDGSVGLALEKYVVANGASLTVTLVNGGEVRRDGIVLIGNSEADTLTTVVDGNTIEDILIQRCVGLILKTSFENTKLDN